MVFNRFELEILINSIRREREKVEKDYIMSIKKELDKIKYDDNDKILCGIGDTSKNLQAINGILIKLENEIEKYRY